MAVKRYDGHRADLRKHDPRMDHRSFFGKLHDNLKNGKGLTTLASSLTVMNIISLFVPMGSIVTGTMSLLANGIYFNKIKQRFSAPYRMPKYLNVRDGSLEAIGVDHFTEKHLPRVVGNGTTYLGFDLERQQQVWVADDDLTVHMMLLGTTKSGKTTAIETLCANALMKGGGFINIDAKGDIVFQQHAQMLARYFGREDDFLTMSFAAYEDTGFGDINKPTNTFNLFANASGSAITEMLVSLMDGQEDVWKGRAVAFVGALIRALVYLRDREGETLSPGKIVEYLDFEKLVELVYKRAKDNPQLSKACGGLKSYLESLPAFNKSAEPIEKQSEETTKQHGFISMQLTRSLGDLTYSYGHIFGVEVGEISMTDVVFNRRILTALLPSLGRSISTLNMLGRLLTSSVKQMMALSLGSQMEGLIRLIVEARPTEARNIFLIFFDEVGFMMSEGMSVIPSQARSLKIASIFSGQSYANLEKGNKLEAEEVWDNTGMKLIGRLTAGKDSATFRKIDGLFDSEYHLITKGYTKVGGALRADTSYEMRDINVTKLIDFSGQENGQFTLITTRKEDGGAKATTNPIRMQMIYPKWKHQPAEIILNDFVPLNMEKYIPVGENRVYEMINTPADSNSSNRKHAQKSNFFATIENLLREIKHTNPINNMVEQVDRLSALSKMTQEVYNNKAAIVNMGLISTLTDGLNAQKNLSADAAENRNGLPASITNPIKITPAITKIKEEIKPYGFDMAFDDSEFRSAYTREQLESINKNDDIVNKDHMPAISYDPTPSDISLEEDESDEFPDDFGR